MSKLIGIVLLAAGIVLLVYGLQGKDSLETKVSAVFKGSADKKATWKIIGGTAGAVAGIALILVPSSKNK